jgi:small-conductance mechanosensitive channel
MAAALLRGDLDAAWHFNPVVLVLGPLIGVAIGYQMLTWALESARLIKLPRLRISPVTLKWLLRALAVLLVVYGIARNLN